MFYGKDMIEENFNILLQNLEHKKLFLFEPMPSYKLNGNWTDEFRIRDGHTKLADGTWVTIHETTTWVEKLKKDTIHLYEANQNFSNNLTLIRRQKREMEYGLRVAEKALKNSLAITKETLDE
jgi:hypothetical protein